MCGISGIISFSGEKIQSSCIVSMTDAIAHRGPDGEGFLISNDPEFAGSLKEKRPDATIMSVRHNQQVLFGHRRLSILDLNPQAAQPMMDTSERYVIVFNGEIYNHATLRNELETAGYQFKTDHSDTEVILNAYAHWGVDCLQKLNGMWAFCLWDKKENTFFMARDRAGKKPLYYTVSNGQLYFASELKAILVNSSVPRKLNEKSIFDFLTYQMVPAPKTIFEDIFKMPAAHYILFKPGENLKLIKYWTALLDKPYLDESEEEIAKGLREKMMESAKMRMVADVEVGVLLSGGVDSSINLACLSQFANRPIKAFSVGFENKNGYKNEFEYAQKVAKHFNADYRELTLTKNDFFDFLPQMVYYQDEPIADPANIPIYYISKVAANEGVKVLLGGEGSDELFAGYEHWRFARDFGNLLNARPTLAKVASVLHHKGPFRNKRPYYHGWYDKIQNGSPNFWSGSEIRSEKKKQSILSTDFLSKMEGYTSFEPMRALYREFSSKKLDAYDWMTATDLQFRLPDLLLARLDRMMMAASVEGRNPFLDVNVIEYAMRIPPHLKTKNGEAKYIIKKAFEGIVPNEIIYRKKDSFTVPLAQLFGDDQYKNMSIDAVRSFNKVTGIFSDEYITGMEKGQEAVEFWNVTNLALWFESITSPKNEMNNINEKATS